MTSVAANEDVAVVGTREGPVTVWSLKPTPSLRFVFAKHTQRVASVDVDSTHIAVSGSFDQTVRVWDTRNGDEYAVYTAHTDFVCYVRFDPRVILTGSWDGCCGVWKDNKQVHMIPMPQMGAHRSVITRNYVVAYFMLTFIAAYSLETGELHCTLYGHRNWIMMAACMRDDQIVTASKDGTVRIWDIDHGQELYDILAPHASVTRCGSVILSDMLVMDNKLKKSRKDTGKPNDCIFSWIGPDGKYVFCGFFSKEVKWGKKSLGYVATPDAVAVNADYVIVARRNGDVQFFE